MADPAAPGDHSAQDIQEFQTIAVAQEDLRARIATTRDVIHGALVLNAQRPGHDANSLAYGYSKIKA